MIEREQSYLLAFTVDPSPPAHVSLWFKDAPRAGEGVRVDGRNYLVQRVFHLPHAERGRGAATELWLERLAPSPQAEG
jgi:hypothetical protein